MPVYIWDAFPDAFLTGQLYKIRSLFFQKTDHRFSAPKTQTQFSCPCASAPSFLSWHLYYHFRVFSEARTPRFHTAVENENFAL
jgi:hypothetical protein